MPQHARTLTLIVLACGAAVIASCNIGVPVMYALTGPPKIAAQFELDSERPTVVLIDDPANKVPRRELRVTIGQVADSELLRSKTVREGKLISSKSALSAATAGASQAGLSIVDVGRRVSAEVVIYAEVTDWRLVSDGEASISPAAALSVRVVDALRNERIFPPEGGQPLVIRLPAESGFKQGDRNVLDRALAQQVGLELARMFFEHDRTQLQKRRTTP